jgi:hypothetical protein
MQIELICTQVQVPPGTLPMIVYRAFSAALGAASRAFPLQPNVDTLPLQVELRFDDLPGVFDAEEVG